MNCDRILAVKKAIQIGLATIFLGALLLAIALPLALPPVVRQIAESKLAEFGYPSSVSLNLGYAWRKGPEIVGSLTASVIGTPWTVAADFGAGLGTYHAQVRMPKTAFAETDPLLARLLAEYPATGVSNLTFSGSVALDASVERTRQMPVPVWSAKVPVRLDRVGLSCETGDVAAEGIVLTPEASGLADHIDVTPLHLRATSLSADGFALSNLFASARADLKSVLVTEAGASTCGGKVSLYSLFLDPKSLNAGFTLFLDNIDAGEMLAHIRGFNGHASGRLHGKVRLFVREGGKAVRLSDAFLYSTPGETGKLKMAEPQTVTGNLAMAGIDQSTQDNVANALTDLDYSVLRFDLKRLEGKNATLGVRIEGSATRGELTVPVNLNLNINGELEQIINTGLGFSNKLKGNTK